MLVKLFGTKDPLFYFFLFFLTIIIYGLNTVFIQNKAIFPVDFLSLGLYLYQVFIMAVLSRKLSFLKNSYFFASVIFLILSIPLIPDTKSLLANSLILTGTVSLIKVLEQKNKNHFTLFTTALFFGLAILLSKNNLVLIVFALVILSEKNLTFRQVLLIITGTVVIFYLYWGIELILTTPEITYENFKHLWIGNHTSNLTFSSRYIAYIIITGVFFILSLILILRQYFNSPIYDRIGYKIITLLMGLYLLVFIISDEKGETLNILMVLASFMIANYFARTKSKPVLKELMLWLLIGGSVYLLI